MTLDPRLVLREGTSLATARERFLTVDPLQPEGVRQAILASWWRSRESNVAADRLEMQYVRDPDLDTPLTRSADPVLRHLREQLDGQPVSIVLTDPTGVVLSRMTADADLERELDRVQLAPGFSYNEAVVGTNGIGTALEAGRAMHVFGHEHYAENLEQLACAGVPVRHPVSGKTVGVLDLTCWRKDAGPLLVTLAKTTAEQIRQALLAETGMREMELLHAYLRACRHTNGMVFALNNDVVMMNATARTTLGPNDQSSLLRHAAEALATKRDATTLELPSGVQVRLHARAVQGDGRVAGSVVHVKVVDTAPDGTPAPPAPQPMLLPGLIGTGTLWRRACREAEQARGAGGWLVLEGEKGVGKLALLKALHQRTEPTGRFTVIDAAEATGRTDARWLTQARRVLAEEDGTIVLRHLERLHDVALRVLTAALQQAAARQEAWIAVTVLEGPPGQDPSPELDNVLRLFPSTVRVPPLRQHAEDIEQLVPFFLLRLGYGGQLTCSSEAMQVLVRAHWPGNVQQVLDTLRQVVRHRRTGVIQPADLPPAVQALSRRRLSALQSIERDAIVLALQDAHGNKAQAARALGMSRATIYRKIHEYGIVSGS
jgi:sigma-54 dependent transcriptional regulator, acetoin dehydrogenase operon transcriptional activator AcoR